MNEMEVEIVICFILMLIDVYILIATAAALFMVLAYPFWALFKVLYRGRSPRIWLVAVAATAMYGVVAYGLMATHMVVFSIWTALYDSWPRDDAYGRFPYLG